MLSALAANWCVRLVRSRSKGSPSETLLELFSKMRASDSPLCHSNQQVTSNCQNFEISQGGNWILASARSNARFALTSLLFCSRPQSG
jgi:hypothetical protein